MENLLRTLILLTLSGSGLALLLLAIRYLFFRKMPSTFYYYAWLIVLLRFLLPLPGAVPVAAAQPEPVAVYQQTTEHTSAFRPAPGSALPETQQGAPEVGQTTQATAPSAAPEVSARVLPRFTARNLVRSPYFWMALWMVGAMVSAFVYLLSYNRFVTKLRRILLPASPEAAAAYDAFPGKKPPLFLCPSIRSPMLIGVFHPMILLSEDTLDEESLTNILRHELMHYRRRDILYKWFAVLVFSVQWFNPMTYVIRRELNRACELSCDEQIIRTMTREQKQSYGDTLLRLAENRVLPAGVVATTFTTEKRNLKERLMQIMKYKRTRWIIAAAVLIIVLLGIAAVVLGPLRIRRSVRQEPWAGIRAPVAYEDTLGRNIRTKPSAAAYLVYDRTGDNLICASGHTAPLYPGNMAKLVTALTVLEKCDQNELVTISRTRTTSPEYSTMNLRKGEQLTVLDLLRGMLMMNCDDAAVELAIHTSGSEEAFLADMNRTASALYCTDTWFESVHGRDTMSVTTAQDLALIMNAIIEDGRIPVILSEDFYEIPAAANHDPRSLINVTTGPAGNIVPQVHNDHITTCFSGYIAETDSADLICRAQCGCGLDLICVVIGAPRTFSDNGWTVERWGNYDDANLLVDHVLTTYWLSDGELVTRTEDNHPSDVFTPALVSAAVPEIIVSDGAFHVFSADQFLSVIGSGAEIVLENDIDLTAAEDYGAYDHGPNYRWEQMPDGYQLVITDTEDLTIRGNGSVTLSTLPRYAEVLAFERCNNITIRDLTVGHTPDPGQCSGGVLFFDSCTGITISGGRLYGCGVLGITANNCAGLFVSGTEIYECSDGAVSLFRVTNASFIDCSIYMISNEYSWGSILSLDSCTGILFEYDQFTSCSTGQLMRCNSCIDVRFLSNTVNGNGFSEAMFSCMGKSAIVDGCDLTLNRLDGGFIGDGTVVDRSGQSLTEDDLAGMEFESDVTIILPEKPASAAPVTVDGVVMVKTVDEFLAAIGPDTTIVLDGDVFDLTTASDYGSAIDNGYYYWSAAYDGPELVIHDTNGLIIRTPDNDPNLHTICTSPRYANVLNFINCTGIELMGFTAGHIREPGSCTGGVLYFEYCTGVNISHCELFGCGILGISTSQCWEMDIHDTHIFECSSGGVEMINTHGVQFTNCRFDNLGGPEFSLFQCSGITLNGQPLENGYHSLE